MDTNQTDIATILTRPVHAWPVLGLRGQFLGTVEHCALDVSEGEISYLVLRTPWQTIDIHWPDLEFDEAEQLFRLIKHDRLRS